MDTYPLIADHGLIGDLHTAALVSTDGEIDWFCSPRFDSPACSPRCWTPSVAGGSGWRPLSAGTFPSSCTFPVGRADHPVHDTRRGGGSLRFHAGAGRRGRADNHRLVRIARVVRGQMRYVFERAPGFDYGRADHVLDFSDGGAVFRAGERHLTMHVAGTFMLDPGGVRVRGPHGDGIQASGTVQAARSAR